MASGDWKYLVWAGVLACSGAHAAQMDEARFLALPGVQLQALDLDRLELEDALDAGKSRVGGWRFALPQDGRWTPETAGEWQRHADGSLSWRMRISAVNAAHLNFGFGRFSLPEGVELTISRPDGKQQLGPFTSRDEVATGQLWTPVLAGSAALIQLDVPADAVGPIELELNRIAQGYRGFGAVTNRPKSGSCNMDVTCLASNDAWNDPRGSVGAYTRGGVDFCTGSLLNNTRGDRRMLFATATHCEINAGNVATVLVYWRYENPTCRTPGSAASGVAIAKPATTSPGLAFLAATNDPFNGGAAAGATRSDWTLLELGAPNASGLDLYWAGWDRRGAGTDVTQCLSPPLNDPSSTEGLCASIHHPNVDEKRITFVDRNLAVANIAAARNVHWLAFWAGATTGNSPPVLANLPAPQPTVVASGVTEPGSSGSPLFSAQKRVIGVLSGGASFCGAGQGQLSDQYGALFHAWEGAGVGAGCSTAPPLGTTCMRPYLDPLGGNPEFIEGLGENSNPDLIFANGFEPTTN